MKEQLIKLAKEKGFESIMYNQLIIHRIWTKLEDSHAYYLWLCELQKWLREKHVKIISVEFELDCYEVYIDEKYYVGSYGLGKTFLAYKQALEKGVFEALKLILLGKRTILAKYYKPKKIKQDGRSKN